MPEPLVTMWEDVDGAGTHGAVFANELTQHAIVDGHAGIFVDMAAAESGRTIDAATARASGLRPYWILVTADDEILPFYDTVGGGRALTMLVRRQVSSTQVGTFGVEPMTRFWVYSINARGQVLYEKWEQKADEAVPHKTDDEGVMRKLTRIPYARIVAGQSVGEVETKPALMTLADLNIEHHQTKTGILNLEQLAMVPTLVRIGAEPDTNGKYPPITIGPRSTVEAPYQPGNTTPVYWLTPDVTVLDPAMKTLEATERAMEVTGAAYLAPQSNRVESGVARKINAKAQNATLARVGRALQDGLEQAFSFSAEYLGLGGGSVSIPMNFEDTTIDPQTMTAYVAAVAQAGLPVRVLLMAWQKGGRIAADVDLDELEAEIMSNMAAIEEQKRLEAEERARNLQPPVDGQQNGERLPEAA